MEVLVKEQILILKNCKNDCNWPDVYKEVKLAVVQENLAENVRQLYTERIKRRMADQVQKLIQKMNEYIESEETLVVCIKEKRARYSAKGHPSSRKIKVKLHV